MFGMDKYPIEINIAGIYFPPILFAVILGAIIAWGITRVMFHYDLLRFIWHPPLFYVALTVICTGLVSALLIPT